MSPTNGEGHISGVNMVQQVSAQLERMALDRDAAFASVHHERNSQRNAHETGA